MPKVSEEFASPYLTAMSLPDDRELELTITSYDSVEMFDPSTKRPQFKWVLWFEESDKGLVLSKGKAKAIGNLHGDEMSEWIGRRIALSKVWQAVGRDLQWCLQVSNRIPPVRREVKWGQSNAEKFRDRIGREGVTIDDVIAAMRLNDLELADRLTGTDPEDWPKTAPCVDAVMEAIEGAAAKKRREQDQANGGDEIDRACEGETGAIDEDDIPF